MTILIAVGLLLVACFVATLVAWGAFSRGGDDWPAQPPEPVTDAMPDESVSELMRRYDRLFDPG